MKIIANENIPGNAVMELGKYGRDVLWVRESMPGVDDEVVLMTANRENRLAITFDKDFGELVFTGKIKLQTGVILFRRKNLLPTAICRFIVDAINSRTDWFGHFSVVEEKKVRMIDIKF